MRVAILADIHGNLPACEAVMADIKRQKPDLIVAAGDIALRGAHPKEVCDLVFTSCHGVLMGNTDCYIAGNYLGGAYREREHWKTELLEWTRDQLGADRVRQLGSLPFSLRYSPRKGNDLYVCHANPKNLEDSLDPTMDELTLRRFLSHVDATAMAFGHLHFPYRRRVGRMVIADVASAGIPRDGDLRPAWGLFTFTPRGWRVQLRRVRYPVRHAKEALLLRHVPGAPLLIHKLLEARYRNHHAMSESARRHAGLPPKTPHPSAPRPSAPLAPHAAPTEPAHAADSDAPGPDDSAPTQPPRRAASDSE